MGFVKIGDNTPVLGYVNAETGEEILCDNCGRPINTARMGKKTIDLSCDCSDDLYADDEE